MGFDEVWEGFKNLSPADQQRLLESGRNLRRIEAKYAFRPGDRVKFKTKHNIVIKGEFHRQKQKYAEVLSNMDRDGRVLAVKMTWNVPPEMLTEDTP